jgi:hypothetical protein
MVDRLIDLLVLAALYALGAGATVGWLILVGWLLLGAAGIW